MLENRPKSQAYSAWSSHWRIDDRQWYLMCCSYPQDFRQRAVCEPIREMTWDLFDTLACLRPMQCWAMDSQDFVGGAPGVASEAVKGSDRRGPESREVE